MTIKLKFIGLLLLTCVACTLYAAKPAKLLNLAITSSSTQPRLILNFDRPVDYSVFRLADPNRVVIDLNNTRLAATFHKSHLGTPFKDLRWSKKSNNSLRLVVDVAASLGAIEQNFIKAHGGKRDHLLIDLSLVPGATQQANDTPIQATTALNDIINPTLPLPSGKRGLPYLRDLVVVIDPGHGGHDPGARGSDGHWEKTVVLAIAHALKRQIDQQPGMKAVLTRHGDYYLGLRQRLRLARRAKADLFISIHADAFRNSVARGASIYALSPRGASNEAAHWLAEKENRSELVGGVDLDDRGNMLRSVLFDLSQTAAVNSSLQVGRQILSCLRPSFYLHRSRIDQAGFVVLKSPDIPSILIETGFISNRHEEHNLASPQYQQQLALAIVKGTKQYFLQRPPAGSWFAWQREATHYNA